MDGKKKKSWTVTYILSIHKVLSISPIFQITQIKFLGETWFRAFTSIDKYEICLRTLHSAHVVTADHEESAAERDMRRRERGSSCDLYVHKW